MRHAHQGECVNASSQCEVHPALTDRETPQRTRVRGQTDRHHGARECAGARTYAKSHVSALAASIGIFRIVGQQGASTEATFEFHSSSKPEQQHQRRNLDSPLS